MASCARAVTFGLPRMHKEAGERRDFLPDLVGFLADHGCEVFVEHGIGSGMGLDDHAYASTSPRVHLVDNATAFAQSHVLALRFPELDELAKLRRGATLISMAHFATRPQRIRRLLGRGLDAIGLDSITDDAGYRLVENMRSVAWNGVEAAFDALQATAPEVFLAGRPMRATVMGVGQVGKHAVEAATKYGNADLAQRLAEQGAPGVEVTVIGRASTANAAYMRERLRVTDLLIDATQRGDPTTPLVPNAWLAELPAHAVICDLVVDPYILTVEPRTVRSIEGIPQGDLDQFVFEPDDPRWSATVPASVPSTHRRVSVTCYSWPGVHPRPCMEHYGRQLRPLLSALLRRGGARGLGRDGGHHDRALGRASLATWARLAATADEE